MKYLFADTDLAAHRLELLANVFAESSKPFLKEANIASANLAVDLGCGPGFSTHFLKVVTARAAALFFFNIQTWKYNPFIEVNYSPASIQQLQDDLDDLRLQSGDYSDISWGMRQIVWDRV